MDSMIRLHIDVARIKYIFWDFDNTLADTERHALPSLIERFNGLYIDGTIEDDRAYVIHGGERLTLEIFKKYFHGMRTDTLCRALSEFYNTEITVKPLYDDREQKMAEHYKSIEGGICFAPHCIEVMDAFAAAGIESCVVTNNPLERAFAAIRCSAEGEKFASRLVGHMGARWFTSGDKSKPHSDVYKFPMRQLGVFPDECIAIEDSETGVQSAVDARLGSCPNGLVCIGYSYFAESDRRANLEEDLRKAGALRTISDLSILPLMLGVPFRPKTASPGHGDRLGHGS